MALTSGSYNTSKVGNFYFSIYWEQTAVNTIAYTVTAHNTAGSYRTVYERYLYFNDVLVWSAPSSASKSYYEGDTVVSSSCDIGSATTLTSKCSMGVGSYPGTNASGSGGPWNLVKDFSNGINHWAWGFKNGEGDNSDHTAKHLCDTRFTATYNQYYTWGTNRQTTIPNGYYLGSTFGSPSWAGTWTNYAMGSSMWQPAYECWAEYDYSPYSYSISYTMNGGTNASSNPSSYNVLYGVTFATPSRTGYSFSKWTINSSTVTGINPGANATFSSVTDMYNKLSSRTTGNKTVVANWTANTYTVTLNQQSGSGGTTSVSIKYDTAKGSYPTITLPTRTGYTFKGYYTGTNGTGTQYYDANGNSTRAFQIASNTTWYAYWTANGVKINVSGSWKPGDVYVNVGGSWKRAKNVYLNVNGTWKTING